MSTIQKPKNGVSLRTINTWLIICAVILSGLIFLSTFAFFTSFRQLTETAERQINLRKAALELMDASDYLTESVQRFTVQGDMQYLEAYFTEAFEAQHREEAIAALAAGSDSAGALQKLTEAMNGSMELMDREYYAMRLVIEAKGYTEYPEKLRSVQLSEEDQALSPDAKMRRATEMVLDSDYYAQKNLIRSNMKASLDELEKTVYNSDALAIASLRKKIIVVRVVIALQAVGVVFLVWMTSRLGIHPILKAVDQIKANRTIPDVGANEFRYLARAYNKMYQIYKDSLARLNYKVSHDELTGVYNRMGYDLLVSSLDLQSTYMILVDLDNFKSINDTYGHEVGDRILIKMVQALKHYFREEDHICRIGGDEFVIFMMHSPLLQKDLIAEKIEKVNQELSATDDGLPPASVSVGIVHGTEAEGIRDLFEKTDAAMYRAKKKGKRTYTFSQQ